MMIAIVIVLTRGGILRILLPPVIWLSLSFRLSGEVSSEELSEKQLRQFPMVPVSSQAKML